MTTHATRTGSTCTTWQSWPAASPEWWTPCSWRWWSPGASASNAPGELAGPSPVRRAPRRGRPAGRGRQPRTPVGGDDPLAAPATTGWLDSGSRHLAATGCSRRAYPGRRSSGRRTAHDRERAARAAGSQSRERPPADGGSAVQVALHGRDAMPDAGLHAAIFEPRCGRRRRPERPPPLPGRRPRRSGAHHGAGRCRARAGRIDGSRGGVGV